MRASILSSAGALLRGEFSTRLVKCILRTATGGRGSDDELGFGVVAELVEDLDSPTLGVDHHQAIAVRIELHARGQRELDFRFKCVDTPSRFGNIRIALYVALLSL